jgi:hypothetical protein
MYFFKGTNYIKIGSVRQGTYEDRADRTTRWHTQNRQVGGSRVLPLVS